MNYDKKCKWHKSCGYDFCHRAEVREGTEVYRHPEGYFVVLEFEGESGKFREAFWPEEVVKDKLFL